MGTKWKPADWEELSVAERNEAVSMLAGWERGPKAAISLGHFGSVRPMSAWHLRSDGKKHGWQDSPPNFMGDLNAIQKAVGAKVNPKNHCAMLEYTMCLIRACGAGKQKALGWHDVAACANATAAERCEAFFKFMTS